MTEQIVIKLNKKQFRPLLDALNDFSGKALAENDSDLVAKTLFFQYWFNFKKLPDHDGKTLFEVINSVTKKDKAESVVHFLSEYYKFKKMGFASYSKDCR